MGYSWQGLATHAFMALCIPAYMGVKWWLNPDYVNTLSMLWVTLAGLFEALIITQINIPYLRSPLHKIASAPGEVFLMGHITLFGEQPPTKAFLKMIENTPNDGLIAVWGFLYIREHIIPTTTETIMEILNGRTYDWEKPTAAKRLLGRILGEGLVNVEGATHKGMRRAVAPAFSGRHIRDLVPLFWEKGVKFTDSMARAAKASGDGAVEMSSMMSRVTLDIIGSAGVGKDLNTIENDDDELARLYETITGPDRGPPLLFFLVNIFLPQWIIQYMVGTVYARIARATLDLHRNIHGLLAEKKQAMNEKTADHKDIIAIIMKSGDYSDSYLTSQLLTFLAAGHDTTASALTFAAWLLSTHPEIQTKLRKECQDVLGGKPLDAVDADLFDNLPYLTAVCNETLRLYPTVPVTARHSVVPTRVGDLLIPKGVHSVVSLWAINRLPELWGPDADKCRPERWIEGPLAATGGARSQHATVTFLHGPRSCIGQSFAKNEMRCVLAALVMRFDFEKLSEDQKIEIGGFVTIKPKGGLRLKLNDLKDAS